MTDPTSSGPNPSVTSVIAQAEAIIAQGDTDADPLLVAYAAIEILPSVVAECARLTAQLAAANAEKDAIAARANAFVEESAAAQRTMIESLTRAREDEATARAQLAAAEQETRVALGRLAAKQAVAENLLQQARDAENQLAAATARAGEAALEVETYKAIAQSHPDLASACPTCKRIEWFQCIDERGHMVQPHIERAALRAGGGR